MSSRPARPHVESRINRDETPARYWHPGSQPYAPVDILLDYLNTGWELDNLVAVETYFYAGYRRVEVYYLTLNRDDERVEMPVQGNPIVTRLIEEHQLKVVPVNVQAEDND